MPVDFLTQEQEARYGRFTGEPSAAQLSRYFHLDNNDLILIRQRRGRGNWLGFALQLCVVRFLGTFVSDMSDMPPQAKEYVASQLGIRDTGCLRSYQGRTRRLHIDEIRLRYGYRDFNSQPEHWRLVRWIYTRAWAYHERPSVLFDLTTARLIENKILLPGVTVVARLVSTVRERTARRLWSRLVALPDADCRARLVRLLTVPINKRVTDFDRLRRPPVNPRVSGLVEALDRLEEV